MPSGLESLLTLFSRAGSSEIILARVYHAISNTESISAENSYLPVEKFVVYDQIGYLAFEFLDGKLVRKEAIKVIQMADAKE